MLCSRERNSVNRDIKEGEGVKFRVQEDDKAWLDRNFIGSYHNSNNLESF